MTAGFGIPVGDVFEAIDPDALAKNWRGAIRQTISANAVAQLVEQLNVLAARCPRVLFAKMIPAATIGGTNWLWRWIVPDYVANATEHELRALSSLRAVDPATGNAYWARVTNALAEDTTCKGPEHAGIAPSWFSWQRYFAERATFVRTAANRAPASALQQEGIVCKKNHCVGGLIVQDAPLRSLDIEDHTYVAIPPRPGDRVLGGGVLEDLRAALHSIRTTNLPIIISWSAIGDGADFKSTTPTNDANEYGIHIESANYLNIMMPNISATKTWETRTASTPGWSAHVRHCGVGDPSTAAGGKLKVNCYVLGRVVGESASGTVRFEGPLGNTEIAVTGALDWYGSTSSSIYLDTTVANNDATAARNKIDVCAKLTAGDELWIYGIFAHVVYGA